jgi:hypothetical protein
MGSVVAAALLVCCGWGVKKMNAEPTGPTGDYDELCIDEETQDRVPDEWCPDDGSHGGGHHGFVYIPYNHGVANPAHPVGSKVTGGLSVKPSSGNFVRGGLGGVRGGGG